MTPEAVSAYETTAQQVDRIIRERAEARAECDRLRGDLESLVSKAHGIAVAGLEAKIVLAAGRELAEAVEGFFISREFAALREALARFREAVDE